MVVPGIPALSQRDGKFEANLATQDKPYIKTKQKFKG